MIALFLSKTKTRQNTLAVVRVDGTGYRELLHSELEKDEISVSWSRDDASLLVYDFTSKATCPQLWLVSVADGKRRELVHEDSTKCIMRAALSPDGQFAAYEVWPIQVVQPTTSKVFVVPTKGGEPRLIYECPWQDPRIPLLTFADWTADGRYLAVKGIHEGRQALFLQPVKSGLAAGAPIFVRVGDFEEASSTLSGALVFEDRSSLSSSSSWHVAAIDPDGNIGKWSPIDFSGRLPSHPSFSPDASQIAYIDRSLNSTHFDLMIRDVATGRERIVYQGTSESSSCRYSSIHPIVFCTISKGDGATDLFSVSVDSGAVERIATFSEARYLLQPPQDDKVFYFVKSWDIYADPKIRWDRITQQEAIVVDAAEDDSHMYTLCLDGRWVLRQFNGNLAFRPASGGNWKTLASGIEDFGRPGSTPNGNWALYVTSDSQGNPGIFEAPFSGGEPRRVGDLPSGYRYGYAYIYFVFSPDARKILVIDTYPKSDMWLLENFEPKTPK